MKFFKNFFVTGGVRVAGVGLAGQGVGGFAQGNIFIGDNPSTPENEQVPAGAEIVAAFLYAQVVSNSGGNGAGSGVKFHGVPLSTPDGTFGVIGDPAGATPCWSGGGGTGQSGGDKRTYSLRYDVLRMLPIGPDGRHQANGNHPVVLPDLGSQTPIALGASLVLIYKDPNRLTPLSAFAMYDGSWAMDNSTGGMNQTIQGFYDPAQVPGELFHIVGSGQLNKTENLRVNGGFTPGVDLFVNPFDSSEGAAWDNVRVVTPLLFGAPSLTTSVDGPSNADCLTWSAVIYRTEVNDDDGDGLLNRWETNVGALIDPNGLPLPPLGDMGADPSHKDLFVEVGYMNTNPTTSNAGVKGMLYGGVLKPHHTHVPTAAAIQKVVAAFAAAPVAINVHFDVGNNHQSVPGVIPNPLARGGEVLDEMATVCVPNPGDPSANPPVQPDPPFVCQFSGYPGTLGWKSGFRTLRDALIDYPAIPPDDDHPCDTPSHPDYVDVGPGGKCERVFDRNRKDIFRYLFFPHFLGVPKAHCLDLSGNSTTNQGFGLPDSDCQATNPLFHEPNTYTGVADFGGGDGIVSMGGFLNALGEPVGTDNQQAGTIMHELGHMLMLTHGGASGNAGCGPNRLSVMNYLFQLRLLIDASGNHQVDYSRETLPDLNEGLLSETAGLGSGPDPDPRYRTAWYAPWGGIGTPATRHCDGSENGVTEQMIRVDGTGVGGAVDWNADGHPDNDNLPPQDINFNGLINDDSAPSRPVLAGFKDWDNIRLNQVGSRRNIGVWFLADDFPYIGPASLDMGKFDFGKFDFGKFDFGKFDFGKFDFGKFDFGDLNMGDLGKFDFGKFDFGKFDFGKFDFGVGAGDLGRGADGKGGAFGSFGKFDFGDGGEITGGLAVAAGLLGPPTNLTACVAGHPGVPPCATTPPGAGLRVFLEWRAPDASPSEYVVYRRQAVDSDSFAVVLVPLGAPSGCGFSGTTFVDCSVAYDRTYEYYVAAKYVADGEVSESASTTATVTIAPQFYTFSGFFSPLGSPGLYWGSFKLGKAVPVKYRLTLPSGPISALSSLQLLRVVYTSTSTTGTCAVSLEPVLRTLTLYSPTQGATGGSTFRWDPTNQQFVFTWDTSKGDPPPRAGCYTLSAQFDDGSPARIGSLLLRQ